MQTNTVARESDSGSLNQPVAGEKADKIFRALAWTCGILLLAFFVSMGIALFITFYAPKKLASVLNSIVDLLAAIPSVIYGLWGGLVLVPSIFPFWNWVSKTFGWIPLFAGPAAKPPRRLRNCSRRRRSAWAPRSGR